MAPAREWNHSRSWPVGYRWLAVGTVVVCAAIGNGVVPVAAAHELFELATGLHVTVPDPKISGIRFPVVSGSFKPDRAVDQLSQGMGLGYLSGREME